MSREKRALRALAKKAGLDGCKIVYGQTCCGILGKCGKEWKFFKTMAEDRWPRHDITFPKHGEGSLWKRALDAIAMAAKNGYDVVCLERKSKNISRKAWNDDVHHVVMAAGTTVEQALVEIDLAENNRVDNRMLRWLDKSILHRFFDYFRQHLGILPRKDRQ